jgi:putative pyruvate formate lyase activating enzyme
VVRIDPAYIQLLESGVLAERVKTAYQRLENCTLCPRACRVNRLAGEKGICQTGALAMVSSYGPHFGEEKPLSGWRGSGTIFFTRCNLNCVFCQNYDISQTSAGEELEPDQIAELMLRLQSYGCHNINLVSPTHVVPQVLAATMIAAESGLHLPIVYNTGGYDSVSTLQLLDGVVDIYMPDMKYANAETARRYSGIRSYPQVNRAAVKEMHRQVGDLLLDERGIAIRGLLVRHLILPNRLAGSAEVIDFLAREISTTTYLNLMDQYHPEYLACRYPELSRRITPEEYQEVVQLARRAGLYRLD